ncbi:MAG: ATPase, T2SS/T4P/T4SS family [Elusimicrobiota bacterium]
MTRCGDEWLVRLLSSKGALAAKDAEDILSDASPFASTSLLRRKAVSKERLAELVREQYGIPFAEPAAGSCDKIAVSLVPEEICRRHMLFPLRVDEETIELLMANPLDSVVMDSVMALSGRRPVPLFGLPDKIEELITAGYGEDAAVFELLHKLPDEAPVTCLDSGAEQTAEPANSIGAPVIRLANQLISSAVRMKASDIHIEHEERVTIVRYRVDGDLRAIMKVPKHIGEGPLVSRIKIMANLDVADRRRPQDGRAKLKVGSEEIGLRVSTMPTSFGEKVVMRILDNRQAEVPLEALGFRPEILSRLVSLSLRPTRASSW